MTARNSMLALLTLAATLSASPALATTWYVDAVLGDDSAGLGTAASPWRTITRAHATPLAPGDIVSVAAGVYDAALGEVFPIHLARNVRVLGAGADQTIVRGSDAAGEVLFETGGGQRYFWLADLTVSHADTGVRCLATNSSDEFLVLERVIIENNQTGVHGADDAGSYCQMAIVNSVVRLNKIGVRADENWQGFGETYLDLYGVTIHDNEFGLFGTSAFGPLTRLVMKHSIVKRNDDNLFLNDFSPIAAVEGCLLEEPSLIGINGNLDALASFMNYYGFDPHLRTDSPAIDLWPPSLDWPPGPLSPAWWGGIPWPASFAATPDMTGETRTDGLADAGCDEVHLPSFHAWGEASLGAEVDLVATGPGGNAVALYLSSGASTPIGTPFGTFFLDAPLIFFFAQPLDVTGHSVVPVTVPNVSAAVGLELFLQGHTTQPPFGVTAVDRLRILP